jgi:lysyl endopeptidase
MKKGNPMKYQIKIIATALLTAIAAPSFANDIGMDVSAEKGAIEMSSDIAIDIEKPGDIGLAQFETTFRAAAYDLISLPPLSDQEHYNLTQGRGASREPGEALAIGTGRELGSIDVDAKSLGMEYTADRGVGMRFSVRSSGAKALRLGFNYQGPTEGITLRFGNELGQVFETSAKDLQLDEINWSPVVGGERIVVEITSDNEKVLSEVALNLSQVSHLDIDPALPTPAIQAKIGESDFCERDVVCRTSPPTNFRSTADAVARMVYTSGGSSFLCTGTLLNNNNTTRRNLFWSANHCISSQTVANTLQTYWFYEATTCGGSTVSSRARTLSGGAFLRHNNQTRDTLLLELKSAPPSGAIYAGWSSAAIGSTGTAIEGIHHPAGDVKMYSLGSVTSLNGAIDGLGPFYRVQWSTGVTEGGSSGSGLFTRSSTGAYQLRGGLYGGTSFCNATTSPDYYSRMADVWTSVKPFLSP